MRRLIFILLAIIGVSQAQTIQYIGAPTTTVISRGNFRTDSIFYLPKRTKLPTDTAALRYQISDSSLYAWTGSQWRKVGADADTLVYSTRAWRQKGDDSLAARINLKVNISDTASMLSPYLRKADTSAMLSPYYRSATATAALATKLNISDTSAMLSPYARTATVNASLATKLNISDTASMLSPYIRHAGYGLTKSGQSFLVDTLNIATRAWRQKGLDSLAALEVSGSGTTNYVPKFTAASTIGNSQIFDNGTNVGIGTASPVGDGTALNIYGSSFATIKLQNSTSGTTAADGTDILVASSDLLLKNRESGAIITYTSNTERLRIFANGRVFIGSSPTDAGYQLDVAGSLRSVNGANFATTSGNVGIGTASPQHKLHLSQNRNTTGLFLEMLNRTSANDYNEIGFGIDPYPTTVTAYIRSVFSNPLSSFETALTFGTHFGSTTEKMRITPSGNVGIGTASPANNGANTTTLTINGTAQGILQLQNAGTKYFELYASSTDTRFENVAGNDLTFRNGSTVNARITSGGNVGIGVTPSAWNSSWKAIEIQQAGNAITSAAVNSLGISSNAYLDATNWKYGANGTANFLAVGNTNGSFAFYNASSGTAGNTITFTQAMTLTNSSELLINTTTDAGDYKLQVSGNVLANFIYTRNNTDGLIFGTNSAVNPYIQGGSNNHLYFGTSNTPRLQITTDGELLVNTSTDAGDYKLQVVGNARVGTGKLDIASNTTFGIGVARSGTSEVAGQIYNSNGILYLGAESSTGGQIFTGSSAYAAVIGSGANYPLQFATNNTTRATITSSGKFIVGATSEYFFSSKMEVNGGMAIRNTPTDGTLLLDSTALNLYGITNRVGFNMNNGKLTGSNASPAFTIYDWTWNTTANVNLVDISLVNTASGASSNYFRISDGTNEFRVTKAAEVVTAAPTGGSVRKWKLGEAATVSPTSPNRTIRVEIDGTVYYLHAKTTND